MLRHGVGHKYTFMLMRCNRDDLKQKSLLSKYTQLQLASLRVMHAYRRRFNSFLFFLDIILI